MNADLQRRVQRYGWDRAEPFYEDAWKAQLAPAHELLLSHAALKPGERVLDVACGTGLVTFPAAEAVGPLGVVLGTDLSDQMVGRVTAEAERRGLRHVTGMRMGAEALDVPDGLFDAVLCGLGMMYFPDPLQSLLEMCRVLKPGSRAVAAVWGHSDRCGWAGIFPVVAERVRTDVCPLFFDLGTGDTLAALFADAGFERVTTDRISTTLRYASATAAVRAAFAGGPVAMAYARFDEATRIDAEAAYLDTISAFRTGDGYAIPGEFVVVRGDKR